MRLDPLAGQVLAARLHRPEADSRLRDTSKAVAAMLALSAVYFVAGKLGLSLAFVHASATAVWPPTGIALAALLLFGYRLWPGILLGAFLVNMTTAGSVASSLGIAVGNTLEALLGAYLVNRFAGGVRAFDRPRDVFAFAVVAAGLSTVVSGTLGVTSLVLTGFAQWQDFGSIWFTWWLGDAGGSLIVAPLVILWTRLQPEPRLSQRSIEVVALLLLVVVAGVMVFGGLHPLSASNYPIAFLCIPVLIWAAYRLGQRETATAIFLLSTLAVWGTLRGQGPFARESHNESLLLLQAFMGVVAVTSMALAAAVAERQRAEELVRSTEERLQLIEERRRAEQALEAEHAHLLQERAARAEAEAAVAVRDQFLSIAAHELKTPMTSLQLSVQLLLKQVSQGKSPEPSMLARTLQLIDRQTSNLGSLVVKLLDTVSLEADQPAFEPVVTDLTNLVTLVVEQVQSTSRQHQLFLSAAPGIRVLADGVRLRGVVTNLLDNAVKYSPEGGRIDVQLWMPTSENVSLSVRDHGIGIPPESLPRIFDRFYQAHARHYRSGLGLGLYIARRIVELHKGSIVARPLSDGGTEFTVTLPAVSEATNAGSASQVAS